MLVALSENGFHKIVFDAGLARILLGVDEDLFTAFRIFEAGISLKPPPPFDEFVLSVDFVC